MPMERRARRNVNRSKEAPVARTDAPYAGYAKLDWIHSAASKRRGERMRNLMHHFNAHNLRRAFQTLDGTKAAGIDHVTKRDYQRDLEKNIAALEEAIRGGGWRPRPAREKLIPKPQGGMRPLAVGCLEDKIVQTLTARILEAVYEPIFHRHSYGFRRGKSAHQALARAYAVIHARKQKCVVVEMDIEKFFNSVDHDWLMNTLEKKIADPHMLRHIRRLLRNSILHEDGQMSENVRGTPQGSPASPVLANICLHTIIDDWFAKNWQSKGEFVRYADDAIFVFSSEQDAEAFRQALTERMTQAGLKLNPDKSGVVHFSARKPEGTIKLLGFELYWGIVKARRGVLKVKTILKRLNLAKQRFYDWIKAMRNRKPTRQLWRTAAQKMRGHYGYYGVLFNHRMLRAFYNFCLRSLFKWLNRRSQKRSFTWAQFMAKLRRDPLPLTPTSAQMIKISSPHRTEWKHYSKSRMPKSGTYGSVRSAGRKRPAFT
jgi:RNA-directed DNA polymerase